MIDIHCHILPGVDDGAKHMEEAVAMGRLAYEDGIRHIIATPHFTDTLLNGRSIVSAKVREVQDALDEAGVGVTLYPGNEVRLVDDSFFEHHRKRKTFFYLNEDETFVLLEQKWSSYEPTTEVLVRGLVEDGVTPIIPHPERHAFFREQPQLLVSLLEAGAWTQVSVDSLLGKNNEDARSFACWLMDRDLIHTIATDAHNVNRKPNLSEGFRLVSLRCGPAQTERMLRRMKQVLGLE